MERRIKTLNKMRAFTAIDLEEKIKDNLFSLIDKLDKGTRNIRWAKRQGMHLTLKFLGEISDEKISGIESVLGKTAEKHTAFHLRLKGTGTFPPGRKNPRVLWVGVEDFEALKILQSEIEAELEKIGFPREKRAFHPHLTLGRVKTSFSLGPILKELEKHHETNFGEMIAQKITFFRSTLKPIGAEYTIISEFKLR